MPRNETISEILEKRAREQGERPAYIFLSYGETGVAEERLTYAELDARARAVGASLQAAGAGGERVALLLPPGPDFIASFFGCLYAGAVAVPALPPRPRGADPRLQAICRDARPRVALTTADKLAALESAASEIPELAAALRMAPAMEGGTGWQRPDVGPEALAFLQYTSGSTSSPKGVMVSHGNLLHNEELIRLAFAQSPESVVLGWLPLYHDMGLIGTVLQPLYTGAVSLLMTPGAFLQRPARWLEAISRYRATTSGGPNFAYDLCVRKVGAAEREALDLSSWEVAFNGAEPVRAGTLRRFAEAFAPCGFRASAFRPCYGLAEATLLVSGWRQEGEDPRVRALDADALERNETVDAEDAARSRELVGCGAGMQTVLAVDPESGEPLAPGRVGEIWVAGPSVAQGYWQRPEETAATFGAHLADGAGPFLRTGDLGFVADGEVFLTGRLKDLIILRGRNHYPQDLELTAERGHADLRAGGGAAFAAETDGGAGEERLVIVHEVDRHAIASIEGGKTEEIAAAVRQAIAGEHEVSVAEVVLIRPETLPRTSSGKVRRRACRDLYLQGGLRVLGASRLSAISEDVAADEGSPDWLRLAFAAAARIDPERIDADLPLSSLGLDSLAAVELKQTLEEAAGVSLPLADLLEGMTLRELERRVGEDMGADFDASGRSPSQNPHHPGPLLPPPPNPPHREKRENSQDAPGVPLSRGGGWGGRERGRGEGLGWGSSAAGEHPLSWNQRSLWFLNRLAPESSAYNIAGAARIESVSSEALGRALQALVDRHPMLRATFTETPEGPVQRVAERGEAAFEVVDAAGWSDEEVQTRLQAAAYRPFDLAAGPLLRAVLVRRGGESFLALAVHHVAADFWSIAVLARELGALVAGETLPTPAALYTDFARRQELMLESPEGERLWEHWRERLAGVPQLDLPTDRPRRPVQSLRGGGRTLPPSRERAEAVHRLAAAHGSTPFVALLASWQAVLSRWSGQEELLTGAPMAGRFSGEWAREWAEVVGYFVNLVPLRADLSGDPEVRELMARTRGTVLDALAHQDLPFALLTERLQPERDPSRPPLVAAMLTFEKAPAPELAGLAAFAVGVPGARLDLGGMSLESLPLAPPASQLDLSLTAAEWAEGLAVSLQWDADLFDETTAGRLLDHFDRLLAGMAAGAVGPVAELPMLAGEERDQILLTWSGAQDVPVGTGCLHELFEAQAARTPEATALLVNEERWTYDELNRRANRLAHRLRQLGAGPEQRVGVLMGRSGEMIAALLGVLKAGAAYVPLDPAYPEDWRAFVTEDAEVTLLLTEEDDDAGEPEENPEPLASPSNLAYVMYTSGSTGRPKGVAIEHRAPVERMLWARAAFPAEALAGVLAATSICFDLSVFEIFAPLSWGGTVILANNALALPSLPARGEVTLINTVPSAMVELAAGELPPALRTVSLAGEPLPPQLADRIYSHPQVERVWNLYGPTEDATYSTGTRVERGAARVSIGRPLPGTRAYVLDARFQPVPGGVPGELFLAGAGGARGYLGRPDLTAERFLPDPFGTVPGGRLYRTGDLARWLASGELEHLGRQDHQVKVRGFRIELGEIEAVLAALPGVREAVVVARENPAGDRRLVAYVVGDVAAETLLQALRERLPDYMVPSALVILPALPLTPSGKVDRKALPAPERAEERYRAPRTPVEELLAGLWAEVLGLERVGVDDHFFGLGGHSLLATRVTSRLRAALGVEVPLQDLFAAPRLADFAARVEALRRTGTAPPAPPLVAVPHEGALPLSFAQQRLWFIAQLEPDSPLYNMPGALRAEGPLDGAVLACCLGEIVRRHEALRTIFRGSDAAPEGSPVQVIRPAEPFPLPVVDLAGLPESGREALAATLMREEAARPFDLAGGPLLRGLLLRLAGRDHVVLLTLYHIAGDGWSLGLLVREIAALYPAFAAGRPSPLPALPVQYADYALWQRSWLQGEVLAGEIDWWRRQLAGLPPLLELPTDRPRPAAQSHRGASRPVRLPAALTRQADSMARREGATLFMVLLAAFQALLARHSGQDDLAVGTPVAGRNRVETEGLIGFFVNTLVLRGDLRGGLAGAPTFRELLGRARKTALAAYLHQDVPFEKLVEELAPERNLAHAPLVQAMLVLQNAPFRSLEIEALSLRPTGVETATAKLDLTLTLEERDGGLIGTVEYATDLFDAPTVDRLLAGFERLLAAAVAEPERRAEELPLLGEAERQQLLEWGAIREEVPAASTLHDRFAARARQSPEAPALTCGGLTVTYGELNRRANRLAHWLRRLGAGPESRVGLRLDRSVDLVVGILGVLKAGAAYVPLDPGSPLERLAFVMEDADIRIVVGAEEIQQTEGLPDGDPEISGDGGDASSLAYVIYTSGSTGKPKGTLITHANVTRLFDATEDWFGFERDVWTLFHSYSFDFSVWEIWGALLHGGRLVVVPWEMSRSPEQFLELLDRERVTVLNQTPSAFAQIARTEAALPDLRLVIFGGEALDPASLEPWFARRGDERPRLINMYGITETTVHVTYRPLSASDTRSVIGVPIPDLSLGVMDRGFRPAPIGVPGELVVGGAGLARGYLGRPELTAERFVPDTRGERLYRSGDLGRYLPNGDVEYLGRLDHQVKIRGFRIELGEIDAALMLAGARQAVVTVREDAGDRRLVAYVVGDVSAEALRQSLRERLPDYMVPAAFVILESLPLTANGKVDRKALPAPDQLGSQEGYVAPRTREEEILAAVWAQVLRLPRVGVNDNFFELGGDSILSVQIAARARQAGLLLTTRQVFEHQTVAGLASHAKAAETPTDFPKAGLDAQSFARLAPVLPDLKNVEDVYPLSPAQNGMLFHSLMAPESGVYVTQVACTLPADLDPGLFRQAWERLVQRHAVLRTAFLWEGLDEPLQVVRKQVSLPWQELDWRGLSAAEREHRFEELRQGDRQAPLPLNQAPLMRFSLIRLDGEMEFLWTSHHLLLDGWSLPLLFQELATLYEDTSANLPPARPFGDYIVWLRQQDTSRAEPFWREELAGFAAPNSLGILDTARPASAGENSGDTEHGIRLSREITSRLQALAARHKVTLPTVTLGAWAVLVSRYSGQEDVVFGSAVSGRPEALPGVETMVGMFINTLPVRARVNGAEPLAACLQGLQERQLARQDFEATPLSQIQRWSEVAAGSPLFETLYVFENYPHATDARDGGGLRLTNLRSFESTNYPLTLTLTAADQVSLHLAADRARVDADAVPRLLQHLATLLTGMAERPESPIGEFDLLTVPERRQLLGEWNDTRVEGLAEGCLHHDVAAQAMRTPTATALEMGAERWTYRRLIGSARLLARHLRELGVGPDSIVGLCAERSPALIVGILAVLEAGGAWLPLDPANPPERMAFQLDDAEARVLLIQEPLVDRLPRLSAEGRHVVLLDDRWDTGEDIGQPLETGVSPDNLAFIIYTSGSTGQPKAVMLTHRGICNRIRWAKDAYGLGERDAFLQKASIGFDVSVWETFAPLISGARLVLSEPGRQGDGAYLVSAIREHGITVIDFVPPMLPAFLAEEDVETCVSLRQIVTGGDTLTPELRDRTLARLPIPLDNTYGPTEITIDNTRWVCAPGQGQTTDRVPIGRPISNTRLYVVDAELRLAPVGVAGELLAGGAGVTRGYLRRPDLTAQGFVPDPFGDEPGERLYRTGDIVRWLPDGSLDILGRRDHQVKIRGFRIELGEIEATLVALPGVREAVVVVREEKGDRRLVAYVAGETGEVSAEALRQSLRERLPDYMVPAVFVTLAALPLTVNGKVDRKALPAPELPGGEETYVAPRTREEEILAAVWADVLRLPRVGVNDNFFELGGDSILSVQIVARARQAGLGFTVRQIFEHQTVAGLALYVTAMDPAGPPLPGQGPVTGEVPLTPIQRWFFDEGFADPHHFNHALLLEPREPLAPGALEKAMAAIVEHHDALRMRFAVDGSRQENAPAEPVTPFYRVDLSGLPAIRRDEAFEQAATEIQTGFDLTAGPLTRLCLFHGEPVRLLWVTHHLVVDGVSWRLLLEDLEGAYRQAAQGLLPILPPKITSFQEWARRLTAHAASEELARELDFWRETARVPVPRLPVDLVSGSDLVGDEAMVDFELTAEETTDLLQTLPSVYHNRIDDALLSSLARALAGWTGSPRLRVDLEGHGREPIGNLDDLDVSRTVGWFTTQYPVVLEKGDASPGEALVSAKERLRAVPGRGIGYGLLRYLANAEAAPDAEISFNYLGQGAASGERSLFRASPATAGPSRSPRGHRTHPLEIVGLVTDGRLRITLAYGSRTYRRETAERLAADYAGALRQLIRQSRESEEVFTPSDFPKARLDARNFDKLAALLAESD